MAKTRKQRAPGAEPEPVRELEQDERFVRPPHGELEFQRLDMLEVVDPFWAGRARPRSTRPTRYEASNPMANELKFLRRPEDGTRREGTRYEHSSPMRNELRFPWRPQ